MPPALLAWRPAAIKPFNCPFCDQPRPDRRKMTCGSQECVVQWTRQREREKGVAKRNRRRWKGQCLRCGGRYNGVYMTCGPCRAAVRAAIARKRERLAELDMLKRLALNVAEARIRRMEAAKKAPDRFREMVTFAPKVVKTTDA